MDGIFNLKPNKLNLNSINNQKEVNIEPKILGNTMDGIYLINKQKDMTSHDVVNILRKKLKTKQIGHAGTLDPMATGLLVILVGKATKLSDLLLSEQKSYSGTIGLGFSTDTYDHTGTITNQKEHFDISKMTIVNTLDSFKSEKFQVPPMYSAIKINGKKLYDYARSGQVIDVPKRPIEIYDIKMISELSQDSYPQFDFYISVSKGTYIRTIAHDFGIKIDVPCHLSALRRLKSGEFDINDAYQLEDIDEHSKPTIDLMSYANKLDEVIVSDYLAKMVKNGIRLDKRQTDKAGPILVKDAHNNPIAIYIKEEDTYKPIIQF